MSENTERRYLKWYNKVGYGSGDVAGNVVYAFLSSFVMIYLTDTVGLNPGIVGTLIAVSKLFDGITDIFFGSMIDKTHSKMGKARPWMLYGYIGCAITLVGIFAIPMGMSEFAKYAWFFICYSLLNAVFYTANNIAYSALTSLVTKNSAERVEMGSYRFMFAFATSLAIQSFTLLAVSALGDTAEAWRTVAIVYAIIGLIVNTLSVFSVKELPEEEFVETTDKAEIEKDEKYGLVEAAKLLVSNKYYLMICVTYILQQIYGAMISMGTYYTAHILGDKNLFGVFSWAINIPLIIALVFTPTLVAKMHGMYKLNVGSYAPCYRGPRARCRGRLYWHRRCQDDAALHGHRCTGSRPVAGRHERRYRLLLRVHLADEAQARGRHDVLLHLARCQAGRRSRHRHHRLAAGVQQL